jgi:hypothetical protein
MEPVRRPTHRRCRLASCLGTLAIVAGALPAAALGDPPPPAVAQYVEMVPTSAGPKAPSAGSERTAELPVGAAAALEREPRNVAGALEQIATSDRYGAPTDAVSADRRHGRSTQPSSGTHPGGSLPTADTQFAEATLGAASRELGSARTVFAVIFAGLVIALLIAGSARMHRSRDTE